MDHPRMSENLEEIDCKLGIIGLSTRTPTMPKLIVFYVVGPLGK